MRTAPPPPEGRYAQDNQARGQQRADDYRAAAQRRERPGDAPGPAGHGHLGGLYFSPDGGAQQAPIDTLIQAKHSIRVQAYYFTSAPLAQALVDAHRRGVTVEILLDTSQRTTRYSSADFFAHDKIMQTTTS